MPRSVWPPERIICTCVVRGCNQQRLEDGSPGRELCNKQVLREHQRADNTYRLRTTTIARAREAERAQTEVLRRLEEEQLSEAMSALTTTEARSRAQGVIASLSEIYDIATQLLQSLPPIPNESFIPAQSDISPQLDDVLQRVSFWSTKLTDAQALVHKCRRLGRNFQRPDVRHMCDMASSRVEECVTLTTLGKTYWVEAKDVLEDRLSERIPFDPDAFYDTARHMGFPLANASAIIQLTAYMVAASILILGFPRRGGVWLLRMVALILTECLRHVFGMFHLPLPRQWEEFIARFPKDAPTVLKQFNLGRTSTVYAACPSCSYLHAPQIDANNKITYINVCRARIGTAGRKRCKSHVLRPKVIRGRSILIPLKPFVYFDLRDWMGELLSRPGYEKLMDTQWSKLDEEVQAMSDVYHGEFLRRFTWKDRKPFHEPRQGNNDARYVLSLGFDFFNPLGNKQSGQKVSIGVLVLACMNIPPQYRYKPENLFLSGIISGPQEPPIAHIDNYFVPLVDQLLMFWEGIYFSSTPLHAFGRLVILALILIVCDLRAARKLTGMADCSHTFFCSRCWCSLASEGLGTTERGTWKWRTAEDTRFWANRHHSAQSESVKGSIFARSGVRWSQFYRLPYFDLPNMLVVDPMHNLYLGLLMQHFRHVLGYNPSEKEMQAARRREERIQEDSTKLVCKLPAISENPNNPKPASGSNSAKHVNTMLDRLQDPMSEILNDEKTLKDLAESWSKRYNKNAFEYLVKGFVDSSAKGKKADLSLKLLTWRSKQVEQQPKPIDPLEIHGAVLSQAETKQVWADIKKTVTPSWVTSVPAVAGTVHGKLKADQWRTLGTLYLPLTLIRLWSSVDSADPSSQRKVQLLGLTMDLVSAVIIASSRHANSSSIRHYEGLITRYLKNLQTLFPFYRPHPNHHMAMHLHEFMILFGPAHSWWCFPWERMIGQLQRLNTNYRQGEYERTIAYRYTEQANFRASLAKAPLVIQSARLVFERLLGTSDRGTLTTDIGFFGRDSNHAGFDEEEMADMDSLQVRPDEAKGQPVDNLYRTAFTKAGRPIPEAVVAVTHIRYEGTSYTTRDRHVGNSQVMLANGEPVTIETILVDEAKNVHLLVLPHLPADLDLDPFLEYPILNARIWSNKLGNEYRTITSSELGVHYAKCETKWGDKDDLAVIISLNRSFLEDVEEQTG